MEEWDEDVRTQVRSLVIELHELLSDGIEPLCIINGAGEVSEDAHMLVERLRYVTDVAYSEDVYSEGLNRHKSVAL